MHFRQFRIKISSSKQSLDEILDFLIPAGALSHCQLTRTGPRATAWSLPEPVYCSHMWFELKWSHFIYQFFTSFSLFSNRNALFSVYRDGLKGSLANCKIRMMMFNFLPLVGNQTRIERSFYCLKKMIFFSMPDCLVTVIGLNVEFPKLFTQLNLWIHTP